MLNEMIGKSINYSEAAAINIVGTINPSTGDYDSARSAMAYSHAVSVWKALKVAAIATGGI
jgi:hypothetical protein